MDEKENTISSPDEKATSSSLTPLPEAKTISGTNTINLPQLAYLRLKPAKSTDSLTHHPLLNHDDEESDVISAWSSQRSRRSSSTSSSSSLQPRVSIHPVPGGSVGGLLLTKLREMNAGFDDIVHMLIAKKEATLLLPASQVTPFENVDRIYLEAHVVISQSTEGGAKVITLNGLKGFIQHDVFKAVGLISTEPVDIKNSKSHKSIFEAFSKPDLSYDYPSIKILRDNNDILLHGMPIQTIVIESPIRTKEIVERISTRTEMEKKVEGSLPESLLDDFIRDFIKNLPKNEDSSIDQIQGLFDRVRNEIEYQIESNGELTEVNDNDINETMNIVEKYVCTALYDNVFSPKWSNDSAADEALCSKIASLNLLELGLSNLGLDIKPQQQERIDFAVQAAGAELQNLEQKKSPHEKLDSLVRCHRIVVEALKKKLQKSLPNSDRTNDATEENSYVTSPVDVSPASIPLPPSPTSPKSPNIPTTSISPKLPMSPTFPNSPTDEKNSFSDPNADAIFPLLIFIVVKSNPKKLVSNLRFMTRYRVRTLLCGESSYCLTNFMAVVQFIESVEYLALGLSDKVSGESVNANPSLEQRTRKVGQDIVVAADNSIKAITGVMDSSVKMFGRLIGYSENTYIGTNSLDKENSTLLNINADLPERNFTKDNNVNDIKMNPGLLEVGAKELAEINTTNNNFTHTEETSSSNVNEETKSFTDRLIPFNVLPRFSNDRNHIVEENKEQKIDISVNKISPPVQKFLDCPIDEFRVNDVPELLAEYKRLANAIRELGLFSS
ncbi:hypothetical protein RhiirC2_758823 [Rhizophagus irregularis]|uniref:VPS9 domain-containing protein n=1 Tax=Rhizophagus irregularis TaxID=588596 RepID=A0A2N1MN32_9GLOM|nr:hypothetical protein RhiirC2_758823 [Rhizophagus irregularis]